MIKRTTSGSLVTVVLAAGAGRRYGGGKLLAPIAGGTVLGRVLAALDRVGDRQIAVLGAEAEAVRGTLPEGWEAVFASDWDAGPGASLRAGLAAAPEAESALVVLGDLAWLRREAVDRVRAAADEEPEAEALRSVEAGQPGHPLLIRGSILARARRAPDEGLRSLLTASGVTTVECSGLGVSRDIDTAADLARS